MSQADQLKLWRKNKKYLTSLQAFHKDTGQFGRPSRSESVAKRHIYCKETRQAAYFYLRRKEAKVYGNHTPCKKNPLKIEKNIYYLRLKIK